MQTFMRHATKISCVTQHRGYDARSSVCRRGDYATACGVLLIDGDCIHTDPVKYFVRCRAALTAFNSQLVMDIRGAALHIEATRQFTPRRDTAVDAGEKSVDHTIKKLRRFCFTTQTVFVLAQKIHKWRVGPFRMQQQFGHACESVWHSDFASARTADKSLILIDDESAADGIQGALGDGGTHVVAKGTKGHRVRMQRQYIFQVVTDVEHRLKADAASAEQRDGFILRDGCDFLRNRGRVYDVRQFAAEPQLQRDISAVTLTRMGERTEEFDADAGNSSQHSFRQLHQESSCCPHRANRVRRRRTDADLEQVCQRDVHVSRPFADQESVTRANLRLPAWMT